MCCKNKNECSLSGLRYSIGKLSQRILRLAGITTSSCSKCGLPSTDVMRVSLAGAASRSRSPFLVSRVAGAGTAHNKSREKVSIHFSIVRALAEPQQTFHQKPALAPQFKERRASVERQVNVVVLRRRVGGC